MRDGVVQRAFFWLSLLALLSGLLALRDVAATGGADGAGLRRASVAFALLTAACTAAAFLPASARPRRRVVWVVPDRKKA